jgi:hypothetical protein
VRRRNLSASAIACLTVGVTSLIQVLILPLGNVRRVSRGIPNPATYEAWMNATSPKEEDMPWTSLDGNPFTGVSYKNYPRYNFCRYSFVTNSISSFLSTLSFQTVTVSHGTEKYWPVARCLLLNLNQAKVWKSAEVHAIYALFFIVGYSQEGLQILKDFLGSIHNDIYDPVLLAQMDLSRLNSIVDILDCQAVIENVYEKKLISVTDEQN